ncbi:MAG: ComEC/Rec2 family competence protein [Prevotellaceae bacterium]|nr:ComEC/Rec2 family competence protein [Prevotellaceae bacterium]
MSGLFAKGETKDTLLSEKHPLLVLYLAKDESSINLKRGDILTFPDNLFREQKLNPGEFDYVKYLRTKGISASLYLPSGKWRRVGATHRFSLKSMAADVQEKLVTKLKRHDFKKDELGVLSAMVLGDRDYMDSEIKDSYAQTGASHILAVSGLHVGVVFFVFNFLLDLFWKPQKWRLLRAILLIAALWIYAFVTGLSPSVVRASIMLSFVCIGMLIGRKTSIYNTLAASAFFLLLYHPFYLIDVGFQLSYTAVLSIVVFQPHISSIFTFRRWLPSKIWSLFTVSVAAQIGTFPISLYYFHQFANYFWLSGFVVVPLSAAVIYLAMFLLLLLDIPFVCDAIATVLNFVLTLMNGSVRLIGHLPLSTFSNVGFGLIDVLFSFLSVVLFSFYLKSHSLRMLQFSMISLFCYFLTLVCLKYDQYGSERFAVFNIRNSSVVNYCGKGKNLLSCNVPMENVCPSISNFWMERLASVPMVSNRNYYEIDRRRIFCLRNSELKGFVAQRRLRVDVLVLSEDADYSIAELRLLFDFKQIVFDSSNSWKYRNKMKKSCKKENICFYDVVDSGPFLLEK